MWEKITINCMEYIYTDKVKWDSNIRLSFDYLVQKTFGISFDNWYRDGYWKEQYIPHVLLHNNQVVANVSVNMIDLKWDSYNRQYIQLGTVVTDPEYRNQGLSKFLIEMVLQKWSAKCDAMFLFANDNVLDFYPRFGFAGVNEYQCSMAFTPKSPTAKKLNMADKKDVELLLNTYHRGNPYSRLPLLNNDGLIMFYCSQFMKEYVYYCEDLDIVVIAEFSGQTMLCYDIFGKRNGSLEDVLSKVALEDTHKIVFGFTPNKCSAFEIKPFKEEDTTLFMLDGKENIFEHNQAMFPLLSHA